MKTTLRRATIIESTAEQPTSFVFFFKETEENQICLYSYMTGTDFFNFMQILQDHP